MKMQKWRLAPQSESRWQRLLVLCGFMLIDFLSQGIPDIIKVNSLYLRYENTMITIERNYDCNPKLINE
ncbi:hypothetical protein MJM99_32900, partial [Salmonella enterica subsp. enterica serovar Kentucky]|nr:hypothetical protein [Salmonella enterica subsp. enterica serovar Kentucky]